MTQRDTDDESEWATEFDVTVDLVRKAIVEVGHDKGKVEMYLKGTHSTTDSDSVKKALE